MKLLIICILSLLSLSAFSQTAKEKKIETQKSMTVTLDESQMVQLYQLLSAGKNGLFDSDQLSAKQAKSLSIFADSLSDVFIKQSQSWHPKTDSTKKK